jgi:soluble lytic murein transglycosylase
MKSLRYLSAVVSVILFLLFCNSCAAQQIQADFYQGLRASARNAGEKSQKESLVYFEKALKSSNPCTRTAAAAEILHIFYNGYEILPPLMNRVKRSAPPSWAAAFDVLGAHSDLMRKKALAFLLGSGQPEIPFSPAVFPDEAARYTLKECLARDPDFFTQAELAAVNGNIAASRSRYTEALNHFRITLEQPEIFFKYPGLLNRLGRTFQYADAGKEGIDLFLEWEKNISSGSIAVSAEENRNIRYRLFFFAGRMARRIGRHDEAMGFFQRALPLAPDAAQGDFSPDETQPDACMWYILDAAVSSRSDIVPILAELMPLWHDKAYFNDIFDKLASGYVLNRRWADIAALFSLIYKYADEVSVAQYAFIIARALQEGLLVQEGSTPAEYMEIAYQAGRKSLYYRLVSASFLQKPFVEIPGNTSQLRQARSKQRESAAMNFLRGFFANDAVEYAPTYIRSLEKELTPDEKRHTAEALSKAGLYMESIRLLLSCLNDGAEFSRHDFEILYPRPYREYVEKYAQETSIEPEVLYGLIHTESAFQSAVVSRAGAVGLTQLLPSTAEEMIGRIRRQGGPDYSGGADALRDPEANIHIGAFYVRYLTDRMRSPLMALLAYNGGMNRIRRWRNVDTSLSEDLFLESVEFPETREYGRKVLAAQAMYKALYYEN